MEAWREELAARFNRWKNPSWWNLLICLPWALGVAVLVYPWSLDKNVGSRERSVSGFITAHEPENHNRYGYSFVVEGKSYTGWETPQYAEPALGQQVQVYYDPLNPERNALTHFEERSERFLGPVPFLLLGIAAIVFLIYILRRNARKTAQPA